LSRNGRNNMTAPRMELADLDAQHLDKLHKLEDELGACVVALQPRYPLADLPPEKISRLQQAEKDLGVVLLAYEKE
jgi:hypothetical protein